MDGGANVTVGDRVQDTPLHLAAGNNSVAVAHLLINNGAKVHQKNKKGMTPLEVARQGGHRAMIQLLSGNDVGPRIGMMLEHLSGSTQVSPAPHIATSSVPRREKDTNSASRYLVNKKIPSLDESACCRVH